MQPEVEFFTDDVDGVEYLSVGLKWEKDGEEVRAVLGAFTGTLDQEAMAIIKGLVETAGMFLLGLDQQVVIDV